MTSLNTGYVIENLQDRDNLLITVGDSWTAGFGAYDGNTLKKIKDGEVNPASLGVGSTNYFKEYSYPWLLSQKLNWDLINLGEGAISNTGCSRKLFDYDITRKVDYRKYKKIVLIFLMTSHKRYTFYSGKQFLKILPTFKDDKKKEIADACFNFFDSYVNKDALDPVYESRFAVRTIEAYCKAHNITFLYGSAFLRISEFNQIYDTPENLHRYSDKAKQAISEYLFYEDFNKKNQKQDPRYFSPCGHPNRFGYQIITDNLYKDLYDLYFKK